jgi:transposase
MFGKGQQGRQECTRGAAGAMQRRRRTKWRQNMKLIALDLHQDKIVSASLNFGEDNPKVTITKFYLRDESFQRFLNSLMADDVAIVESTMNSFWMYRQIAPRIKACYVLNTNAVHLRGNKTDALDARKLLQILASFVITNTEDQIPSVYVPSEDIIKIRSLFTTYRLLLKISTQCRNRIHALYGQNGIVVDKKSLSSKSYLSSLPRRFPLDDYWAIQVKVLLDELADIAVRIGHVKKTLLFLGTRIFAWEIKLLLTISGMSPLTAIALMADICDIHRFTSAKKMCAYLRTTPSVKASNKTSHLGHVNPAGRSLTVTLLTQSINHLKEASESNAAFYRKLRAGKSAGKSRIALIRKVLTATYYMLKQGIEYRNKNNTLYEKKIRIMETSLKTFHPGFPVKEERSA